MATKWLFQRILDSLFVEKRISYQLLIQKRRRPPPSIWQAEVENHFIFYNSHLSKECKAPVHSVKISHDERFIFAIVNEDDYQSIKVIDCKSQQKFGNLSYVNSIVFLESPQFEHFSLEKSGEFSISAVSHDNRFIILRKESEIHVLDLQIGFSYEDIQSPETSITNH